ncbi:hypothetical protein [Pseudomonas lini]
MKKTMEALDIIHSLFDHVHSSTFETLNHSREDTMKLIEIWVSNRKSLPTDKQLVPKFSQFIVSAWALNAAQDNGELSEMGDWIGWSLSDSITNEHTQTLNIDRLIEFHTSPSINTWIGFVPTMVVYLAGFYYYARERSAMKLIAEEFWTLSVKTFHQVMNQHPDLIDPPEIFLGVCMLCWAGKESPDHAREFAPYIENLIESEVLPGRIKSLLCLSLATTAGQFSSLQPQVWAERALTEFEGYLVGEQKLQMMASLFHWNEKYLSAEPILAEMELVQAKNRSTLGEIRFLRDAALRIGAVQPYFAKCMATADTKNILEGLQNWYQIRHPGEELSPEKILVTMPFGEHSFTAVLNEKKYEVLRNNQTLLERVVNLTNAFLGTAKTVAYADNAKLVIPDRPGVPNQQKQETWDAALLDSYCPQNILFDEEPLCQLIFATECHPIQATQLLAWGKTWPIAASLSNPRPDRKPMRVALWSGGGSMTEKMEIELVKHIFQKSGASVEVFEPTNCSLEDFITAYQDPSFDIFWVMSHGEFDHWSPKDVKLQISHEGQSAALKDIWGKAPPEKFRRLLVLNVCDGARFEERGLLPKIGLAAGLAGPEQATISHLWPVMGFPSAAFGVYLAHFLMVDRSYFEAYQEAVKALQMSAVSIADDLRNRYGNEFELVQKLANRDEDYSIMQIFGSAAFYQ